MAKKQFYGVSYPFTTKSNYNTLVDMNETIKDKIRSILMHVIFTPKGQKLRDPEFGSNLIKFIFEPTDDISLGEVKNEVSELIRKYVGEHITLNDLTVMQDENNFFQVYVKIEYTVYEGYNTVKDSFVVKL